MGKFVCVCVCVDSRCVSFAQTKVCLMLLLFLAPEKEGGKTGRKEEKEEVLEILNY